MNEEWNVIEYATNYSVSKTGKIKNSKTNLILKPTMDRYGYYKLNIISNDGVKLYKTVHRLVAETWIENKKEYPQVNHIDGNKLNNSIENLEWCTSKENIIHSYEMLLNKNTRHTKLINLDTKDENEFKSLKELAKFININSSVLIPLIRNSNNNPILGKYVIILNDGDLNETANTTNFGRTIYVKDYINDDIKIYNSILIAAYYTGIRSLSNIGLNNDYIFSIGYCVTLNPNLFLEFDHFDKEKELINRNNYLNIPYKSRSLNYYAYDYYKKIEKSFPDIVSLCNYLITEYERFCNLKVQRISMALGDATRSGKSGLLKGIGIKSDLHPFDWFPYNEEVILSSMYGLSAPNRIYLVKNQNEEKVVVGILNLCKYLNYCTDKPINKITDDEVIKSSNIPNLSIKRLNKPIN